MVVISPLMPAIKAALGNSALLLRVMVLMPTVILMVWAARALVVGVVVEPAVIVTVPLDLVLVAAKKRMEVEGRVE